MRLWDFGSEIHTKKDSTYFWHYTLKPVFWGLNQKISPLSVPKNIGDCVPSQDASIGTPLHPPLFWLDNIFSCEYLCEFKKKFETVLMGYSGAGGKLIHEKNLKSTTLWHCPLKQEYTHHNIVYI